MADASQRLFEPDRLPRNLAHDAVTIYEPKQLPLFAGDRIRWTENDRERGLLNGDLATVERAERDAVIVRTQGGERLQLGLNDPMREKLDLAYAVNVHIAQGMTATNGIILMSEREKLLNTSRAFLVAVTRIAERAVRALLDWVTQTLWTMKLLARVSKAAPEGANCPSITARMENIKVSRDMLTSLIKTCRHADEV